MTPEQVTTESGIQLLDVRLEDDFEATHIEGATNNCVFEVAFPDRLESVAPDKTATTVVYGANTTSHEASAAAEKLKRAGYEQVHILEGGLERAEEENLPLVKGKPLPAPPVLRDGAHAINREESRVGWLGKNLLNKHCGFAPVKSGELVFSDGQLTGGEIRIDLTQLSCTDLEGSDLHDVLIAHLENDDFFDVERHPEAILSIRSATQTEGASKGAANLEVEGDLTLRGQTHPITFHASAGITDDGKAAAQAAFAIDRTRWGVLYGSGKFFHRLAGHLVNDEIEFQVRIVT